MRPFFVHSCLHVLDFSHLCLISASALFLSVLVCLVSLPFYYGSSRSNPLYGFYSLSLSLSPLSVSLPLFLALSLSLSFCPFLATSILVSFSSSFGSLLLSSCCHVFWSLDSPPCLPSSLPSFLLSFIHPCPSPVVPSFLPFFLSFLPLVSFMPSRIGGHGERKHRRTGEHAEKRD